MNHIEEYKEKTFEDIKHIDDFDNEYWEARELMWLWNIQNRNILLK